MNHRKPRSSTVAKTAVSISMAAGAGIAMTTSTASAATGFGISHDVATAVDLAHSRADRTHVRQFEESFRVHEFGPSVAVTANNRATAESVGCSPHAPCRSIALSFQIVTTSGRNARLVNTTNISRALNEHCAGCETFAGSYQFVVATPRAFTLSGQARSALARLDRRAAALQSSNLSVTRIRQYADDLAHEVKAVLDREAARAPRGGGSDPLADFDPTVTMHRHVR
ncbi:hypothetical protein GFH48_06000 [Streptomyces fagopyri]|uniref:Uncharacterized protein n=1 Tax=Streptomyces fagopyri TaxID=2662397 RepID=A0A5Q0L757_9ACTN|nr:hypothetical protein [Streptomyces fagopyri]QFZ72882.1 hypothetical protein GFH48_06000 [Streptomyces fagopyri]